MIDQHRVIAIAPVWNEAEKIRNVIRRMPREVVDEVLVVDDGSDDGSARAAREEGASVVSLGSTVGVGAAIRRGYEFALEQGYEIAVVVAGNDKDAPEEIPQLIAPILNGEADFVQGSRYLKPGADFGAMPLYRRLAVRVHPLVFSAVARQRVTESTNGFRALHRRVLEDKTIDLRQKWLDHYELEPYLYLRAIQSGWRTHEVAVTKRYPPKALGQTKMRPVVDWWSILKPLVLIGLGVRK